MVEKLDNRLINEFRDKVNTHDYVFKLYHDRGGKDHWSIICSAMDWIDVVVDEIDATKLTRKNDNASSIKMMTFINCVDILWEAIQQLHRVFFNTSSVPFSQEKSVFRNKLFDATDNDYFKTLRACFSAHPVNLHDYFSGFGVKEKRYASWSGGGFGHGDFSVILYSNIAGRNQIFLDIFFDDLLIFAHQRYQYLNDIMEEIDVIINSDKQKWLNKSIERCDNPVQQIKILIKENEQRLQNDYYSYELAKLKHIFETVVDCECNKEILEKYQKALLPAIDEIFENLQTMRIDELQHDGILNVEYPAYLMYDISKLCGVVFGSNSSYPPMLSRIETELRGIIDISNCRTFREIYVLTLAGFYYRTNNT